MAFKTLEEIEDQHSNNLVLTIKIDLNGTSKTAEELEQRLQFLMGGHQSREISNFIVFLLREASARTWEAEIGVTNK